MFLHKFNCYATKSNIQNNVLYINIFLPYMYNNSNNNNNNNNNKMACCTCNGVRARCVRCICVKNGTPCASCLPRKSGSCSIILCKADRRKVE